MYARSVRDILTKGERNTPKIVRHEKHIINEAIEIQKLVPLSFDLDSRISPTSSDARSVDITWHSSHSAAFALSIGVS